MTATVYPNAAATDALNAQELAVLGVLLKFAGRVISRQELSRQSGLSDRSERRCDAILVEIRRVLGEDSIRTVRSRGWMLNASGREAALLMLGAEAA
jgi:hypothetical protein